MSTKWLRRLLNGRSNTETSRRAASRRLAKPHYRLGLELLEARLTPATVKWIQPGSGQWSIDGNWEDTSTHLLRAPRAGDAVVIDLAVAGGYTVTLDTDPALSGLTLNSSNATLVAGNHTLVVNGPGTLTSGTLSLGSATWDGTGTLTNNASIVVNSFPTIKSAFVQNGNLIIQGAADHAVLTVSSGFTNAGKITLTSNHDTRFEELTLSSGVLTNTGTIEVDQSPPNNEHIIDASINNVGTISIQDGAHNTPGNTITNTGTFNVAAGVTFGSQGTFNQNGGTINADGVFSVNHVGASAPSGAVLAFNSGAVTGNVLVTNSALINGTGNPTGTLTLESVDTMAGDVAPGETLIIHANLDNANLTANSSFTNAGKIILRSDHDTRSEGLTVTDGILTNTGAIQVDDGPPNNLHTIDASINNTGVININADARDLPGNTITNTGIFKVATGFTFSSQGTFNQNGGIVKADGVFAVNHNGVQAPSGAVLNFNSGAVTGIVMVINSALVNGAGNPTGTVIFESYNTLAGDVPVGETLYIRGDSDHAQVTAASSFTNAGTILLNSAVFGRNQTLAVTNGILTNTGTIQVPAGSAGGNNRFLAASIINRGLIDLQDDTILPSDASITNTGTVTIAANTTFTMKGFFNQFGGSINVSGTFVLPGAPATFNFNGGTAAGNPIQLFSSVLTSGPNNPVGTFVFQGSNTMSGDVAPGETLLIDGNGDNASVTAASGFTNAGTIILRDDNGSQGRGYLLGVSNGVLTNTGTITLGGGAVQGDPRLEAAINNAGILTVLEPATLGVDGTDNTNLGTMSIDAPDVTFNGKSFTNSGVLSLHGNTLTFPKAAFTTNGLGTILGKPQGNLSLPGNFQGNGRNASGFNPIPTIHLTGQGTQAAPQLFEVMSKDQGAVAAGFSRNFVVNTLTVAGNDYVKLIDNADNYSGSGPEALYVNNLVVPGGSTLDLNGLHVYVRAKQVSGTIVGGTLSTIPDSGPLFLGEPVPGGLTSAGETDDWTFFGKAGQTISATVDATSPAGAPPLQPLLNYVQLDIVDSTGKVLATADNSQSGNQIILTGVDLPADGAYHFKIKAPAAQSTATGNYVLTVNSATSNTYTLDLNRTVHGNLESYAIDRWTFSASSGQQVRFGLEAVGKAGLEFDLVGPNGYAAFVNAKSSSDLITLPSTGTYAVVVHGEAEDDGGYAFRVDQTATTTLTLGSPFSGTIAGSGQYQLFKMDVPSAGQVQVTLLDPHTADHNELYVRIGSPPTRTSYQFESTSLASANQILAANVAEAGTLYILMYTDAAPAPGTFSLVAKLSPIVVNDITPNKLGNGQDAVLTIFGGGFDSATTVSLVASNSTVFHAAVTQVDSATQITVTFGAGAVPAGVYTLRVSHPNGESSDLVNGFTFTTGGQAILKTNIVIPNPIGYHIASTLYAEYTNAGDLAMPAPLLVFTATQNGVAGALLTLDSTKITSGFWTTATPEGYGQSVQILASGKIPGQLLPGESARVPIYYGGWLQGQWDFSRPPIYFTVGVIDQSNAVTLDLDSMKSTLRPTDVSNAAWEPIFQNLKAQLTPAGSTSVTWGNVVKVVDNDAAYLGHLGENVKDISSLWAFELQRAIGFSPLASLASTLDGGMATPGLQLAIGRSFPNSIISRNASGPFGLGWTITGAWDRMLSVGSDGAVAVTLPNGSNRTFLPDSRHANTYFTDNGDFGVLSSLGGGAYTLQEKDGQLTAFSPDGHVNYVQDSDGNRITAGYTGGLLTSLTHSSGAALHVTYSANRITTISDSIGRTTKFTYDATNTYLLTVTGFDGRVTSYTYNTGTGAASQNALASVAFPNGTHDFFTYDPQGRLLTTSHDGGALTTTFAYNLGQVSLTDANNATSQFFFDNRALVAKIVDPLHDSVAYTYDDNENLVSVTDPEGHVVASSYDKKGNLISATDALGHTITLTYVGPNNQLASVADANGNTTSYQYDSQGNAKSVTYADGSKTKLEYDATGDPLTLTNRNGNAVSFTYYPDGRVKTRTFSDGTVASIVYDARGNLKSATDSSGSTALTYDPNDQVTDIHYPNGLSLHFTYDLAGRRTQMVDQGGFTVSYTYDSLGRLQVLKDGNGAAIVSYTYDPVGRVSRKDMANGTFTTFVYDDAGNLTSLVNHAQGGAVDSRFDYTYDHLGLQTSMATLDGAWTYTYDVMGQLTHAVFTSKNPATLPNQDLAYSYDAAGNRVVAVLNGTSTNYVSNNLNQYTSVGATTFKFDQAGNQILRTDAAGTTSYAYDDYNRLVGVSSASNSWTYQYDALGNRISSTHNGEVTNNLIDPYGLSSVVGEFASGGAAIDHFTYGLGLASRVDNASSSFYDFNGLGSTVGISNAAGAYTDTYSYLPTGEIQSRSGSAANPFTFVGQFGVSVDGNGLSYMRARSYDATTGRFTSADPLGLGGGANAYTYASNNPIQVIDPLGLKSIGRSLAEKANLAGLGDFIKANLGLKNATQQLGDEDLQPGQNVGGQTDDNPQGDYGAAQAQVGDTAQAAADDITAHAGDTIPGGMVGPGTNFGHNPELGKGEKAIQKKLGEAGKAIQKAVNWIWGPHTGGNGEGTTGTTGNTGNKPGTGHQGGTPSGDNAAGPGANNTGPGANSFDPNQLTGPAGYGAGGFVLPNTSFAYQIEFENDPTATAPAQRVLITDQIDSHLDWSTFQFTSVDFGDNVIQVPAGLQNFSTVVSMTFNNQTFEVDIDLSFNPVKGIVTVVYQSINPDTELPPDVLTGFLPPEDNTGRGIGHVNFVIQPKTGLPTGIQIRNIAVITFDVNPPISTDQIDPFDASKGTDPAKQALNTIDAGAPTSSVVALPVTSPANFTLSWSGSDDTGGSGIATYDIYVSDNGGAFTPLLTATASTSHAFNGVVGHTYGFYSVATDNLGHRQPTPSSAQTTTTIGADSIAPTSSITVLPKFSKPNFTLVWSGSDNAGGSGIATYDIYVSDNGGTFAILLSATSLTTTTFHGVGQHTYAFYSVATDKAGNRQATPASAQASTQTVLDTPFKQYVAAVYVTLLQRSVDITGLNYWSGRLENGDARGSIAAQLTHSAEYFATNVIKPAYQQFLNRNADQGGLDFWTSKLQGGLTDEQMQAGFIASDEFYRIANNSSSSVPVTQAHDRAWIDALYMALLGRGPDQNGEDYWTGQLQGVQTRLEVSNDFTGSTEGLSVRIQQTYQRYLGRPADPGGLAFWLSKYHAGAVNEDIVTGFISSDEFFDGAIKPS
jgi:RHS repeat-associated protein